jgi:hypothetical protein
MPLGEPGSASCQACQSGGAVPAFVTAVAAAPGAPGVRVWEIMSRGRGPADGASVAGGCSCCLRAIRQSAS